MTGVSSGIEINELIDKNELWVAGVVMDYMKKVELVSDDLSADDFYEFVEIHKNHNFASNNYMPSDRYKGEINLILAMNQDNKTTTNVKDKFMGWNGFCDKINLFYTPGGHISMMNKQNSPEISSILNKKYN